MYVIIYQELSQFFITYCRPIPCPTLMLMYEIFLDHNALALSARSLSWLALPGLMASRGEEKGGINCRENPHMAFFSSETQNSALIHWRKTDFIGTYEECTELLQYCTVYSCRKGSRGQSSRGVKTNKQNVLGRKMNSAINIYAQFQAL